jgi:gluconolactonase
MRVVAVLALLCCSAAAHQINLPASLCAPGERVELVIDSMAFTEGPVCDSRGNLFFSEINRQKIWKITPQGSAVVFRDSSNHANGLVVDALDRLIACERNRLTRTETDGSISILIEDNLVGASNDLSLVSGGGIFFTSPAANGNGSVLYLSPGGSLHVAIANLTGFPNGIEYIEEKKKLYVAISRMNQVWRYDIDTSMNGINKSVFIDTINVPDGFALDEYGNFWVTSNSDSKVFVYDSAGRRLGDITIEGEKSIQNCCFGAEDYTTLYIAANAAVYRLNVGTRGRMTTGEVSSRQYLRCENALPFAPAYIKKAMQVSRTCLATHSNAGPAYRALRARTGIYAPDGSRIKTFVAAPNAYFRMAARNGSIGAGVYLLRFFRAE